MFELPVNNNPLVICMKKICTICKEEFPLSDFWNSSTSKDGKRGQCKHCELGLSKERYLAKQASGRTLRQIKKDEEEAEIDRKLKAVFGT